LESYKHKVTFDALTISGRLSPNTESKTRANGLDHATEKLQNPEGLVTPLLVSSPLYREPGEGAYCALCELTHRNTDMENE
jgi:hypothetical protein